MNTLIQFTVAAALILSIILPMGYFLLGAKTKKRYKKSLAFNCFRFRRPAGGNYDDVCRRKFCTCGSSR